MKNRNIKYIFGRFNVIANYVDKKEFLLNGLATPRFLTKRDFIYGYFDVNIIKSEIGSIINGYFVKYAPIKEELVAETKTHKINNEKAKDRIIACSRFFLDVKTGIIAYHPITNRISKNQFTNYFSELFKMAFNNFFVDAEIQAITEPYNLLDCLKRFNYISSVVIKLHPSNPNNREAWEKIDKKLHKLRADKYEEKISADRDTKGLKEIESDEDLVSKIYMSEDGYGEARVHGEIDGEKKVISTKDNPVASLAPPDDFSSEDVLNELIGMFKKLIERMKN